MIRTRYWRVAARAAAAELYDQALQLRTEEMAMPEGAGARDRLQRARFEMTDRAVGLEERARRRNGGRL